MHGDWQGSAHAGSCPRKCGARAAGGGSAESAGGAASGMPAAADRAGDPRGRGGSAEAQARAVAGCQPQCGREVCAHKGRLLPQSMRSAGCRSARRRAMSRVRLSEASGSGEARRRLRFPRCVGARRKGAARRSRRGSSSRCVAFRRARGHAGSEKAACCARHSGGRHASSAGGAHPSGDGRGRPNRPRGA